MSHLARHTRIRHKTTMWLLCGHGMASLKPCRGLSAGRGGGSGWNVDACDPMTRVASGGGRQADSIIDYRHRASSTYRPQRSP